MTRSTVAISPAHSAVLPAADRAGFVDALRAFALVGICVVNLPFLALPLSQARDPAWGWDALAQVAVSALFEAKFFLLFSVLFGFGFARQLRRIDAGQATPASYGRRLAGLFAFGVLHAVLLFPGDILIGYAVLGCILWTVRRWPDARLLRLSAALAALAAPLLGACAVAVGTEDPNVLSQQAEAAMEAYGRGTFGDAVRHRLTDLATALPFIAAFNWPLALAAFCVGLVAGRRDLLSDPGGLIERLRPYASRLALGAAIGNGAFAAAPWLPGPLAVAAVASLAAAAPCLSALYVLGLARLWQSGGPARIALNWASPGGRMSLTNYLGQSLVANVVFMGWGLGLFGQLPRPALLPASLAIALGLIAASRFWLRGFVSGPDEWLMRSWITLRVQPFRR